MIQSSCYFKHSFTLTFGCNVNMKILNQINSKEMKDKITVFFIRIN